MGWGYKAGGKLKEGGGNGKTGAFVGGVANGPANKDQRNGHDLGDIAASILARGMARCHVSDLMSHDAGQFGLFVGGQDQSGIHVEESAGQRESVDVVGIDHLNSEWHLGIRISPQVLT